MTREPQSRMRKSMKLTTMAVKDIRMDDARFKISPEIEPGVLTDAVRDSGLLSPPIVIERGRRFIVLSGWKRMEAVQRLDIERIPVFILKEKSDAAAFELPVFENLTIREYRAIEKAEIIAKFKKMGLSVPDLSRKYLISLSLPPRTEIIEDCLNIHSFSSRLKQAAYRQSYSFPVLRTLTYFEPEERDALIPVLKGLSKNSQMEVLENIRDIMGRDTCVLFQIFKEINISDILESKSLSDPQKSEKIRQIIRDKRYPSLTSRKERFQNALKTLGLPENFTIITPKNFEAEGFRLQMRCRSFQELKNNLENMKRMAKEKGITILFDVLNDD